MNNEAIMNRLQKILALARQGVGGEKENAERMLNKLLAKHGLTIEALDDAAQPKLRYWFQPKSKWETTLLVHLAVLTTGDKDLAIWYRPGKGHRARGFDLTPAQNMELDLAFTVHRKAMDTQMLKAADRVLTAYLSVNDLGVGHLMDEPRKPAPALSEEDLMAIMAMMRAMSPTPVYKALEHN